MHDSDFQIRLYYFSPTSQITICTTTTTSRVFGPLHCTNSPQKILRNSDTGRCAIDVVCEEQSSIVAKPLWTIRMTSLISHNATVEVRPEKWLELVTCALFTRPHSVQHQLWIQTWHCQLSHVNNNILSWLFRHCQMFHTCSAALLIFDGVTWMDQQHTSTINTNSKLCWLKH